MFLCQMAIDGALFIGLGVFVVAIAVFAAPLRRWYERALGSLEVAIATQAKHDAREEEVLAEEAFQRRRDNARAGKVRGAGALSSSSSNKVSPGDADPPSVVAVTPALPLDQGGGTCELNAGDVVQARECKSVRGRDIYDPRGAHYTAKVLCDNRNGTYAILWEGGRTHPGDLCRRHAAFVSLTVCVCVFVYYLCANLQYCLSHSFPLTAQLCHAAK